MFYLFNRLGENRFYLIKKIKITEFKTHIVLIRKLKLGINRLLDMDKMM